MCNKSARNNDSLGRAADGISAPQQKEISIILSLLAWYDAHGRSLPFRGSMDPYAIWVSEIMLQQTRTGTVGPYYTRFLQRFPTASALAQADEQEVLKLWEGLGYYSRARNLHKAARMVTHDMGGRFPTTARELEALPGVGPYTAAAIASIAYDEPVPAMDGNLQRVISRLYNIQEDVTAPTVRRALYSFGLGLMPPARAGDMNQALMDLGAVVCVSGTPDCAACPIQAHCLAYHKGEPERLPVLPRKKAPRQVAMQVLLLTHKGKILVRQRNEALLRGLYVFCLSETERQTHAIINAQGGLGGESLRHLGTAGHIFTHRVWDMTILHGEVLRAATLPQHQWVSAEQLEQLPLPTAMRAAKQWALLVLTQPGA